LTGAAARAQVTAALKLKRPNIVKAFREQLDALYTHAKAAPSKATAP